VRSSIVAGLDDDTDLRVGSFYPWPIDDDDVRAALEKVSRDGGWGKYHGAYTTALSQRLSEMHGIEHITLCSSGTVAVELALRGLKIGVGDEVILAGYDFPGNFRAIEAVGGRPVLVDIDPRTWCLDAALLEAAVSPATKAIIASHLHGGIAAMRDIMGFAQRREVAVLEDACQAPGAAVNGRLAGTWGDVAVLSFGGSKLLTAGRGGAVLTRHAEIHQRIKIYSQRGNDAFPLSELQAAVVVPQLDKLDARNEQRRRAIERIQQIVGPSSVLRPLENATDAAPSFYKFAWLYAESGVWPREELLAKAQERRVPVDAGFRGFARRTERRCRQGTTLTNAAAAAERTVLLHHPLLLCADGELDRVAAELRQLATQAAG
jgi:dTDP-4-amino-4,6-dideoxygalactose transaminase